jgi:hypothetical protein
MKNLGALLIIGLVVYAVIDVLNSREEERIGLPKWAWIILILVFEGVGSVVWLVVSRMQRARQAPSTGAWGQPAAHSSLTAPDDDPEFLWRLDQKRRQAERDAHRDDRDQSPE